MKLKYQDEVNRSMDFLAQDERTIFVGQAIAVPGTSMTHTVKNVPREKLIELPVFEEMQLGLSTGLALAGYVPVSIYPRWNFLLLAVNQLVNHLDKLPIISSGGYRPKVIIRTGVGSVRPLNPQDQHTGDFTEAFRLMCKTIEVIRLDEPDQVFPAYKKALEREDGRSTLIVEVMDNYNEK
jgi:pyruvate/2-oxoglutarate/acetoin dehydrogenase E1 component